MKLCFGNAPVRKERFQTDLLGSNEQIYFLSSTWQRAAPWVAENEVVEQ